MGTVVVVQCSVADLEFCKTLSGLLSTHLMFQLRLRIVITPERFREGKNVIDYKPALLSLETSGRRSVVAADKKTK